MQKWCVYKSNLSLKFIILDWSLQSLLRRQFAGNPAAPSAVRRVGITDSVHLRGGSRGRVQGVRTPPGMACGFLINTVQSLHSHTKSAVSFDMYSQQFTLCYFLVKSPLLRIRFYNFLRHQSVSGAPPPKKNPWSAPAPHTRKKRDKKLSLCQWTHHRWLHLYVVFCHSSSRKPIKGIHLKGTAIWSRHSQWNHG